MEKALNFVPRIAIFLAGVAAGALTLSRREGGKVDPAAAGEWKSAIAGLEDRMAATESASEARFTKVETRLDEHAAKLAEVPSTAQIVAAMEQLLSKTMTYPGRPSHHAGSLDRSLEDDRLADRQSARTRARIARFSPDLYRTAATGERLVAPSDLGCPRKIRRPPQATECP